MGASSLGGGSIIGKIKRSMNTDCIAFNILKTPTKDARYSVRSAVQV